MFILSKHMLHYVQAGNQNAPPVLFLHGFLGAAGDWEACAAALNDRFRCIAVDLPGHGQSLHEDDAAYTFPGCAEALIAVLDRLQITRCSVVGYSMGGRMALHLTNRFPERVGKLVLESASPGLRTDEERAARRAHDAQLAHALETTSFAEWLQRWYAQPLFRTLAADNIRLQRIVQQRQHNDPHELARTLRGFSTGAQPSLWNNLAKLDMPLLLVVGAHDAKFREIAGEIAALQPRAQVGIVLNAGHNVHEEQPDTFAQIVRAFLAEDAPGGACVAARPLQPKGDIDGIR